MVPVIVLNGTVLVIWAATDPLKYVRIILTVNPLNGMTASSAGLCQSESNSLPYMAALATIQLALLAYGNYLVYKTRMVDTRFQESRWIAFAMVCYFEILALALPVLALVSDKVEAGYIVKAGVVFLNNITILCLLFPKFSPLNSVRIP